MPTIFTKDSLRAAVEAATGGKATVLYDDKGYPSYMYRISKFNLQDIDPLLGNGVHPAFVVNGVEKSELLVGMYQARIHDGRACSYPGVDPSTYVNYDTARNVCKAKGAGWHLMTNWEWAAIALWCLKNGFQPRGNTNYGRAHDATFETATRTDKKAPGDTSGGRTLTGAGPASWRHDGTPTGIADLVGNVVEIVDGLKLIDGKIYMPNDNNFDMAEADWPNTGFAFDNTVEGAAGAPILSNAVTKSTGEEPYSSVTWKDLTAKAGLSVPSKLAAAGIAPLSLLEGAGAYEEAPRGTLYMRNVGERVPYRGGYWFDGSSAGLFSLILSNLRSSSSHGIGFRPAFLL